MDSRSNILAMPLLISPFIFILVFPFSQATVTLKGCKWYLVRTSTAGHSAKDYECSEAAEKEKKQQSELQFKKEKKENQPETRDSGKTLAKISVAQTEPKDPFTYIYSTHN